MKSSSFIAASCILGVLGAIAIMQSPHKDFGHAVMVWLIYAVACGSVINYSSDLKERQLWIYSLPSPTVLLGVILFRMEVYNESPFSGVTVDFKTPHLSFILLLFWLLSVVSVWVFSHAKPFLLDIFSSISDKKKRKNIVDILNWTVKIIGLVYLLINTFLNKTGG